MQLFPLRFIPESPKINFLAMNKITYGLSIFLLIFSICWISVFKFNFGIDFVGGISMEVRASEEPDLAKMREVLGELGIGEVVLQNFGTMKR